MEDLTKLTDEKETYINAIDELNKRIELAKQAYAKEESYCSALLSVYKKKLKLTETAIDEITQGAASVAPQP